jgi:DNA repair ATPase RecN
MIRRLAIRDLALMDRAELELGEGFTVVTGETGAGKSVLLGAFSLLAGNRVTKTLVRKGAEECTVEAELEVGKNANYNKILEEFKNEDITQNTKIKIAGSSKFFIAEKVSDANTYNVLESNIAGIEPGYFLKISDIKIGGSGNVTVYRKVGDKFEELKTMKFNNVTEIVKNPS